MRKPTAITVPAASSTSTPGRDGVVLSVRPLPVGIDMPGQDVAPELELDQPPPIVPPDRGPAAAIPSSASTTTRVCSLTSTTW